jgi:light-independent protochlorophyllide reductase subunit B
MEKTPEVTANLIGPLALGFRHRDDIEEVKGLLYEMGIGINVVAPFDATPQDLNRLGQAHVNVLMYPEHAETAARHMERTLGIPYTKTVPIGVGATHDFVAEVAALCGVEPKKDLSRLRQPWWSKSVDSTYLTGKRVFLFGDATHVRTAARIARDEMGFEVVGLGCYNREFARSIRQLGKEFGVEALISDDYLEVEKAIEEAAPEMILGTQMERHIGKRLGIPCAVISAPVHVQDFPARYSPQMGWEGANVIFDTWIHPLVMGLEEHLLAMFREDFEFHDEAGPSHHGGHARRAETAGLAPAAEVAPEERISGKMKDEGCTEEAGTGSDVMVWLADAERELKKIPFFVRGKARRNTEKYAAERGVSEISVDTLYEAKAHFAR